jgi:hypothetical protein
VAPVDPPALRSRTFFRVRVGVLLAILVGILLWAWRDVRSRRARNEWTQTLEVALVVVRTSEVDAQAIVLLRQRVAVLETRLTEEARRHRPGAPRPFALTVVGPVDGVAPPGIDEDGVVASAKHGMDLWQYTRDIDARAAYSPAAFDSRIYVAVRAPASRDRQMIEGDSEEGGRIGTVRVELDASMVDFALFVVSHELLHTLGATDKYDPAGRVVVPDGLAEPDAVPRYPQRFAEVMTRGRPVSASTEEIPASLDELAVGPGTAREIGWLGAR